MTTIDDMATEREEQFREAALRERENRAKKTKLRPIGECLMCGETELSIGSPFFCCAECRKDWEAKDRARRIAGVV